MSTLSEIYGHCPVCGMQGTTAGFVCGHNPFTSPNPGSDSAPIQYSFADSRDAEIAKLREALTNITTEIVKSTDLAVRMVEAKAWASCALNLSLSMNRINGIAVQALAEPEGKP